MELRDRKMLQRLMIVQGVSNRSLAKIAGWKSHSYMNRLVSGEAKNLEPEPALRIAKFLGVGVEDLFLTKVEHNSVRSGSISTPYATKHKKKVTA
ncbi:Cro/C1-type HTH DNA-binding domain-containing protein [Arthrobacter alpinus]|uniref:Cro/C1-type HTH DNA-binding domain-containing protein n=2 Tax=Arthrobacter alpinus TaxID=656366 RepID=A0A1H5HAG5_9MICC|nr:Cro/C1-type HTH DNA-binding domain-containing protein [Arthrobacter alpinus]